MLNGGRGADQMAGGLGDDTYFVDNVGDRIIERRDQGFDRVQASVSFKLTAQLEELTLTGTDNINGTGNRFTNTITGNTGNNTLSGLGGDDRLFGEAGNDILDGGEGSDFMSGGAGNDRYLVDNTSDRLIEAENQGIDVVEASVDFSLGANFENLILTGTAINGTGNDLANRIVGNASNNTLSGGAGNDELIGGAGNDTLTGGDGLDNFTFGNGAAFNFAELGVDTITDFVRGNDFIVLSRQTFSLSTAAGSILSASEFQSVANNDQAAINAARIVFSRGSNTLFYNPNGTAAGFGTSDGNGNFAVLNGTAATNLSASDILVV
ncbi:MAG: hypothetical protein MUF49_29655 [Oculatellaceae cyanobacterium Prado106]|nr:hypothetical protein [Oculatellaceae cyanobacterium Prado106]